MKKLLLGLLTLVILVLIQGCTTLNKPLSTTGQSLEDVKDIFERPYVYVLEDGVAIKKSQKYPELEWRYNDGYSCLNPADFTYLIQFLVQLNGVIDQYEEQERGE